MALLRFSGRSRQRGRLRGHLPRQNGPATVLPESVAYRVQILLAYRRASLIVYEAK